MSDHRNLLENAAKEMGIDQTGWHDKFGVQFVGGSEDSPFTEYFNSITDDGDYSRMEAALEMNVEWLPLSVTVGECNELYFVHSGDKQAARRMAGTRAAAERGEKML